MAHTGIEVRLAQYGMGMSDAEVTEIHKKVGDRVAKDEPILTVDAAKATVEVPAPADGIVTSLEVEVGDEPLVGDLLAVVMPDE